MELGEADAYSVLLIEHEQQARMKLVGTLEDLDMECKTFANTLLAKNYLQDNFWSIAERNFTLINLLSYCLQDDPNYHLNLVLLDADIPGSDPAEFVLWLRDSQEFKHIPVVFLYKQANSEQAEQSLKQGAIAYFVKPVSRETLKSLPLMIATSMKGQASESSDKRVYRVLHKLGAGGQASVDLVFEKNSQREFARKQIQMMANDSLVMQQANNEVEVFKKLKSPFILEYIESYCMGDKLYIVMEYAKNGELHQSIKNQRHLGRKFGQKQVVKWLTQVSLGLAQMHKLDVMHRDLKPQNLFLLENDDVKLGDFGISKEIKTSDKMTSTFCGTPYYMPPEVYRQESYSLEADIWALGCAFYETMTLTPPFELDPNSTNENTVGEKVLHGEPSPPLSPMYSEPLRKLVLSMLAKNPRDRPTIMSLCTEFYQELSVFIYKYIHQNCNRGATPLRL